MIIALLISVIFNIEPIGSLLWGLYPLLIPIEIYKVKKEKRELEYRQQERENPLKRKKIPTFEEFVK